MAPPLNDQPPDSGLVLVRLRDRMGFAWADSRDFTQALEISSGLAGQCSGTARSRGPGCAPAPRRRSGTRVSQTCCRARPAALRGPAIAAQSAGHARLVCLLAGAGREGCHATGRDPAATGHEARDA
jgi:hypothetical protein